MSVSIAVEAQAALMLEQVKVLRVKRRQKKVIEEATAETPAQETHVRQKHTARQVASQPFSSQDTAQFDLQR